MKSCLPACSPSPPLGCGVKPIPTRMREPGGSRPDPDPGIAAFGGAGGIASSGAGASPAGPAAVAATSPGARRPAVPTGGAGGQRGGNGGSGPAAPARRQHRRIGAPPTDRRSLPSPASPSTACSCPGTGRWCSSTSATRTWRAGRTGRPTCDRSSPTCTRSCGPTPRAAASARRSEPTAGDDGSAGKAGPGMAILKTALAGRRAPCSSPSATATAAPPAATARTSARARRSGRRSWTPPAS